MWSYDRPTFAKELMERHNNTTATGIEYRTVMPVAALWSFVESFWMLINHSGREHEIVVLPDGRVDILFSFSATVPYHIIFRGLDTRPEKAAVPPGAVLFGVSFKLLAIEYLVQNKVAPLLNGGRQLPADFWGIAVHDLSNFDVFCEKITAKLISLIIPGVDGRKKALFDLIYASGGALPVKELSGKVFWSSRQINRYFTEQFGISLKAYCNILRFRASLQHIKNGRLFPEQNFADQNHFIKEVKKFAGVVPKELFQNQNDRFILLSAMPLQ